MLSVGALKTNTNSKGNTGNILVDIFNGREMNHKTLGLDFKLQTLRFVGSIHRIELNLLRFNGL